MKKRIVDFIVDKRYLVLITFTIGALFCLFISSYVNINRDMMEYLPSSSETRIGSDIMEREFGSSSTSDLNLMFEDLDDKMFVKESLQKMEHVLEVKYDESSNYNKDNYTLYVLTIDDEAKGKNARLVYDNIVKNYDDYKIYMSGSVAEWNKPVLHVGIIILAIVCAMIILIIMCESYIEPFLFLYAIGLAVFVNMGTNLIFSSVSNITSSIVAILQLALSMDYSIMLMNRYSQERKRASSREEAMKKSLLNAFGSIASSSVTTIVGLLALVFMSFTIGKDLGFVLAKGVFLSLVSIFLVLPSLILLFDNIIVKTKKKSLNVKMNLIASGVYKLKYPMAILFVILFGVSFLLKGNLHILYTGTENDEIAAVFEENNQIAIVYENKYEEVVADYCRNLEDEKISNVLCYGNTIGENLFYDEVNGKLEYLGLDVAIEDDLLKIIYYDYYNKDIDNKLTLNEFVNFINKEVLTNEEFRIDLDKKVIDNIHMLEDLTNKGNIKKKMYPKEMANSLGIDKDLVDNLYVLYFADKVNNKIKIDEFVTFINKEVITDKTYGSMIDASMKRNINMLLPFISKKNINTFYTSEYLASILGIEKSDMDKLMLLYYKDADRGIKLSIKDIFIGVDYLNKNTDYLVGIDTSLFTKLNVFATNKNNINNTKMSYFEHREVFKSINPNLVDLVYSGLDQNTLLSPLELCELALRDWSEYLSDDDSAKLKLLVMIMGSTNNNTLYSSKEFAKMFSLDNGVVNSLYTLVASVNGYEFKMSIYEAVNVILTNKDLLQDKIDSNVLATLDRVNLIMMNVNKGKSLSSKKMADIMGISSDNVKLLYSLYDSKKSPKKMNLIDFTDFIIKEVMNDKRFSSYFKEKDKNAVKTINEIMKLSLDNKRMSATQTHAVLANLTDDLDVNLVRLVYLYYASANEFDEHMKLSLETLVKYISDDVIKRDMFKDFISDDMQNKITDGASRIDEAKQELVGEHYSRIVLNTKYSKEGNDTFSFVARLKDDLDRKGIYVIGESSMAYEMNESFNGELNFITLLTMLAIFVVVAVTFKSLIIPCILILIIQCAVYITMAFMSLTGSNVYFISLLIVQSILMGATIDYAIVYTSYYLEARKDKKNVKDAIISAYNNSIHTILCSSSILVIVTLVVGNFASAIAAKICLTLSKGCFASALLILLILPVMLAIFDRFIIKNR